MADRVAVAEPAHEPVAAPTAAELEAAVEVLARALLAQLRTAVEHGRLETTVGAARGLDQLATLVGAPIASHAFKRACGR
jgi:hypothetical protein